MIQPGSAPSLSLTRRSSLLLSRLAEATSLEGHWIYFGPQSGWTTVELKKYPVKVSTTPFINAMACILAGDIVTQLSY
jgi:hypothetical protein